MSYGIERMVVHSVVRHRANCRPPGAEYRGVVDSKLCAPIGLVHHPGFEPGTNRL